VKLWWRELPDFLTVSHTDSNADASRDAVSGSNASFRAENRLASRNPLILASYVMRL
jgi:hypothetical protein